MLRSSIFGHLVAKFGPETHPDRRGSSYSAGCTENQPWRPHLSPFAGHFVARWGTTWGTLPVSRSETPRSVRPLRAWRISSIQGRGRWRSNPRSETNRSPAKQGKHNVAFAHSNPQSPIHFRQTIKFKTSKIRRQASHQ